VFQVKIDDDQPYPCTYPNPTSNLYCQWYISPTLSDGPHTIVLLDLVQVALDYATVTPGPTTPLDGKTVIVDDTDPRLVYEGNWKLSNQSFSGQGSAGSWPDSYPYQNGTHWTNTSGDSVTFRFTGASYDRLFSLPKSHTFLMTGSSISIVGLAQ
jgi:hypothetical protein